MLRKSENQIEILTQLWRKDGKKVLTMDEYIKRDYAVDSVLDVYCDTPDIDLSCEKFESAIRKIQAADVAPVVHGRWEWLGPNRLVTDCMCGTCSACKVRSKYIVNTMLCPHCGAKMDGGAGNGCDGT